MPGLISLRENGLTWSTVRPANAGLFSQKKNSHSVHPQSGRAGRREPGAGSAPRPAAGAETGAETPELRSKTRCETRCVTNWHNRGSAGSSNSHRSRFPHGEINHFPRRLNKNTSDSMQDKSSSPTLKSERPLGMLSVMRSSTSSDEKQSEAGQSVKRSTRTVGDTSISTWSSKESETSDLPMLSMCSGTIQTVNQFAASLQSYDTAAREEILSHQKLVLQKTLEAISMLQEEEILNKQYESSLRSIQGTTSSTNQESKRIYGHSLGVPKLRRDSNLRTFPGLVPLVIGNPTRHVSCCLDPQEPERPSSPDASLTDSDQTLEYWDLTNPEEEHASSGTKTNSSPSKRVKRSSSMI